MKSYNLEEFYSKFRRHISLASSYTEIRELEFIIKACRLKPYNIIENKDNKLVLHRWWFDEFGNSFKIVKNNRLKIVFNDLALDRSKIICSDLYYGLSIPKVIKMSKLGFFFFGKEEDLGTDCAFIALLGIDGYLRCFMYLHDIVQNVSPLYIGVNNLKFIYKNLDIKYFLNIKNIKDIPVPCTSCQAWLSYVPMSDDFNKIINLQNNSIIQIIKENIK